MSNSKFFGNVLKGVAVTLLGMMAISGLIIRPIVRVFDVSENFVSSMTAIMMLMGLVSTVAFIAWYLRLTKKMEQAINPGLVDMKCSSTMTMTAVISIALYAVLAIVNIGFDDWGALMFSTVIGVAAAALASGLLYAAMQICREI